MPHIKYRMTPHIYNLGETIKNISKIIERDSKTATYKFALLRGTIDIIMENSPYIEIQENKVIIPTGLLVEKWLLYYYPLFNAQEKIPQIAKNTNLAFFNKLKPIIEYYETNSGEGLSIFYNDLKNKGIPKDILVEFTALVKSVRNTIVTNPMYYIGKSVNNRYNSIYQEIKGSRKTCKAFHGLAEIISNCGNFSIPLEYYEAFSLFGSFIGGQDSILFKWADFSSNLSIEKMPVHFILDKILVSPITEREIKASKKLYQDLLALQGGVRCVWTNNFLKKYDVDHLIPFSIWKNNDLWNLLPSNSITNNQKRDKIPSPLLIEQQKDLIISFWELIRRYHPNRFDKEFRLSLLGNKSFQNWQKDGIEKLKESCNYLILNRGFDEWNI